jgi:hypothetical protein
VESCRWTCSATNTDQLLAIVQILDSQDRLRTHVFGDLDAVLAKSALSCIGDNRNKLADQFLSLVD